MNVKSCDKCSEGTLEIVKNAFPNNHLKCNKCKNKIYYLKKANKINRAPQKCPSCSAFCIIVKI